MILAACLVLTKVAVSDKLEPGTSRYVESVVTKIKNDEKRRVHVVGIKEHENYLDKGLPRRCLHQMTGNGYAATKPSYLASVSRTRFASDFSLSSDMSLCLCRLLKAIL